MPHPNHYPRRGQILSLAELAKENNVSYPADTTARELCNFINIKADERTSQIDESLESSADCNADVKRLQPTLPNMVEKIILNQNGVREFDLDALKKNHETIEITKIVDESERPLKDIATNIVVNEFFKTEETLFRFLSFVYQLFVEALSIYCHRKQVSTDDVFFMFKGGNILRLVSREFLLELPASATRQISEFYAAFFKRSDSDFSVYINPEMDNYDEVFHEVTLLSYLLQDQIRLWFETHLSHYFDFFRYSAPFQQQVLTPYLKQFNAVPGFENAFTDFKIGNAVAVGKSSFCYSSSADSTMRFVNDSENWLQSVRIAAAAEIAGSDQQHIMRITHNNTLDFAGGTTSTRSRFNLTRTKLIFTLLKTDGSTKNVGGELIDVSVPHRLDSNVLHFFLHRKEKITSYTLKSNICIFEFMAPSLAYMILDLEDILFVQRSHPWVDRKYAKRVNRLFYLYFVDIFVRLENGAIKLRVLQDVQTMLKQLFLKANEDDTVTKIDTKTAAHVLTSFDEKHKFRNLHFNSLIDRLRTLMAKLQIADIAFWNEMLQTMTINAEFTATAVKNVREYCSIDGRVFEAAIKAADVGNFV